MFVNFANNLHKYEKCVFDLNVKSKSTLVFSLKKWIQEKNILFAWAQIEKPVAFNR